MKIKVYALTAHDQGGVSLYSKMFIVSVILAVILAFLPLASAFAAPANVLETDDLAREWQNKVRNLRAHSLFYEQVRLIPADFEDPDDLTRAQDLLNKYGVALRQATRIVSTRAGFDINGKVTNDKEAFKSVSDLAENLRIMRAIWMKLDEGGYELHRIK